MASLETPRFPDALARGITVGPSFATRVVTLANGREQRNQRWSRARWMADAATAVRTMADFQTIEAYFYAVAGRTHSFRLRDPADHTATTSSGLLQPMNGEATTGAAGSGYGVQVYQLVKRYTSGALSHDRWITKPASGTVTVYRAASPVTVGASPGNIALDTTNGRVTFVADQSRGIISHTVGAAHQFTLASAFSPNLAIGGRLWVTGVTGTAATLLNSLPLEITNVSAAVITVAVNTTGLTASGGTAYFYPQPTETLTWAGTFDVHCRFDTDRLDRNIIGRAGTQDFVVQATQIPLVEVR